jgi:hypothetical protein
MKKNGNKIRVIEKVRDINTHYLKVLPKKLHIDYSGEPRKFMISIGSDDGIIDRNVSPRLFAKDTIIWLEAFLEGMRLQHEVDLFYRRTE